jgi:hypothetical protein
MSKCDGVGQQFRNLVDFDQLTCRQVAEFIDLAVLEPKWDVKAPFSRGEDATLLGAKRSFPGAPCWGNGGSFQQGTEVWSESIEI